MSFFTRADLAAWLQQDVDNATADLLIETTASAVRDATGQTITLVADDPVLLPVDATGCIVLPQVPVVDVTAVAAGATPVAFTFDAVRTVTVDVAYASSSLTVTYSHGSDAAAHLATAKRVALALAARLYTSPATPRSEATGPFSATWADGAGGLLPHERADLAAAYGASSGAGSRRAFTVVPG